jgi:molybdate transport system substrate-binding protein
MTALRRFLWLALLALAPGMAAADDIVVFAASSLKPALEPAAADWTARTGIGVKISFGSSAALAQQIDQGAPADVFLSAAVNWMDFLQEDQRIAADTRINLWGNSLSLITHDLDAIPFALDAETDLSGRLGDEKLAMALVDSVPVGQYGKAALEALGLWDAVKAKAVQTQDARATLALVATGEAGFGVVYATDALAAEASGQAIEVARFPEDSHAPIIYPGAKVVGGKGEADDFLEFLSGPEVAAIFAAQGYVILPR